MYFKDSIGVRIMKSCFMFGHGDCPESILPNLEAAIENCYKKGVTDFYIGNRGQFDRLGIAALRKAKEKHPDICVYLLLAYHPAERPVDLWGGFDNSYYPPLENVPRPYAIVKVNQYMVNSCNFFDLLCKSYWKYEKFIGICKKAKIRFVYSKYSRKIIKFMFIVA